MVADAVRDGVRLYHGLSGELPQGLHKAGIRGLMTVHDLIFMRHPEYYKPVDVWLYKRKFYQSLRECDRIVAISECTKRDILYYSDYPADRIDVIYQSCDTRFRDHITLEGLKKVRSYFKRTYNDRFMTFLAGWVERQHFDNSNSEEERRIQVTSGIAAFFNNYHITFDERMIESRRKAWLRYQEKVEKNKKSPAMN